MNGKIVKKVTLFSSIRHFMMPFIHLLRRSQEKSSTKILTFDIAFQFGEDKNVSLLKKISSTFEAQLRVKKLGKRGGGVFMVSSFESIAWIQKSYPSRI